MNLLIMIIVFIIIAFMIIFVAIVVLLLHRSTRPHRCPLTMCCSELRAQMCKMINFMLFDDVRFLCSEFTMAM